MPRHHFIVGTFNREALYTLAYDDEAERLEIVAKSEGRSAHSWLAVNVAKDCLYATEWREPPGIAAYRLVKNEAGVVVPEHINSVAIASRSGYVCVSDRAVYSAGGAMGDVLMLREDGGIEENVQTVSYVGNKGQKDDGSTMDFGGLRHGAHSADLSPDGKVLYVADIGRNCVWCMNVDNETGKLTLGSQSIAPRSDDGPRHAWPHPSGKILYSLQEHTSMVDVFAVEGSQLTWLEGVRIIPDNLHKTSFWADEVRLSPDARTLFASTRGLEAQTKGWLAAWSLDEAGRPKGGDGAEPLARWETPTSGGWANAIEPAPWTTSETLLALTDSEEGLVLIVRWDGRSFSEVSRVKLDGGAGAATAVWLD